MLLNPDAWFTVRPATASVQPTVVIDVPFAWAIDDHVVVWLKTLSAVGGAG